jgi:hypothetical protein
MLLVFAGAAAAGDSTALVVFISGVGAVSLAGVVAVGDGVGSSAGATEPAPVSILGMMFSLTPETGAASAGTDSGVDSEADGVVGSGL